MVLRHGPKLEVLAVNHLDDGFDASPALVDGDMYLRGYKNMYCIAEKEPANVGWSGLHPCTSVERIVSSRAGCSRGAWRGTARSWLRWVAFCLAPGWGGARTPSPCPGGTAS